MTREPSREERKHTGRVETGEVRNSSGERERAISRSQESARHPRRMPSREGAGAGMRPGRAGHPLAVMQRMASDMDRLFEQLGVGPGFGPPPVMWQDPWALQESTAMSDWSPQVEMFEKDGRIVIRADLPGVDRDDVDVQLENDVLTLSGERRDEREERGDGFYRSERSYGRFARSIPLPEGVDAEACDATFRNGVLEVTVPYKDQQRRQRRKIQLK